MTGEAGQKVVEMGQFGTVGGLGAGGRRVRVGAVVAVIHKVRSDGGERALVEPGVVGIADDIGTFDEGDHFGHGAGFGSVFIMFRGWEEESGWICFGGEEVFNDRLRAGIQSMAILGVDEGEVFAEQGQGDSVVMTGEWVVNISLGRVEEGVVESCHS